MTDLIESCRIAMRRRIFSANIAGKSTFQRDGFDAPKAACYVRESVMEFAREELSQSAMMLTVLCEYDIFIDRDTHKNVTAKAADMFAQIKAEFDPFKAAKVNVTLSGWSGVQAFIRQVPSQGTAQFEPDSNLYKLPVMVYVEIVADKDAAYGN